MRPSRATLSPVVTLLSPSPSASRRAQEILGSIFGLETANCGNDDDAFQTTGIHFDSVASQCPLSGALVHWLSLENSTNDQGSFSLLGITRRNMKEDDINQDVQQCRALLANNFPTSMLSLRLRHFFQRPMTADALLKRHGGLPVLDLPQTTTSKSPATSNIKAGKGPKLKEVAFTMYDDAIYEDGSTVLTQLSQSALLRPVTGLYEWPDTNNDIRGVCLRPLPAAQRDFRGSPSPLVLSFHCESLEEAMYGSRDFGNDNTTIQLSKIGFTGQGNGQLRVQAGANNADPLSGLDVRWCERTKPTSVFPEAQESLLASSLPELQSPNVLKSTGKEEPGKEDARIGSSDCWVEVRTLVKNPKGFVQSTKGPKVATAPPSYPE